MTKFEATAIVHRMIDEEVSMQTYCEDAIKKKTDANEPVSVYETEGLEAHKRKIEALRVAGMALTGEA